MAYDSSDVLFDDDSDKLGILIHLICSAQVRSSRIFPSLADSSSDYFTENLDWEMRRPFEKRESVLIRQGCLLKVLNNVATRPLSFYVWKFNIARSRSVGACNSHSKCHGIFTD